VIDEVFLPLDHVIYPSYGKHVWHWHTSDNLPDWRHAGLIVFGLHYGTDEPDFGVCRNLQSMEWSPASNTRAVHLGLLPVNPHMPRYTEWLNHVLQYIRAGNPDAKIMVYANREIDLEGLKQWYHWSRNTVYFTPAVRASGKAMLASLIDATEEAHLHVGGIQQFYTVKDFSHLASFPQVDIWRLSDLKEQNDLMEVIWRDASLGIAGLDVLAFHVAGNRRCGVAGFDIYDWVNMFYQFGLSLTAKDFVLSGLEGGDFPDKEAEAISMGIWHIWEGMKNKTEDFPLIEREALQKVEFNIDGHTLSLYLNPQTGRWWIYFEEEEDKMLPVSRKSVDSLRNGQFPFPVLKYFV